MEARVHFGYSPSVSPRLIRPNFVAEERTVATNRLKDWRQLCEAVVEEQDPEKFLALVIELNNALDERERWRNGPLRKEDVLPQQDRTSRSLAAQGAW